jgi:Putative addiction module component
MSMAKTVKRLFICLDNAGYEVSLERLKIYVSLPDAKAERTGYLRIIDESGEDYLYPRQRFIAAELPISTRRTVLKTALAMEDLLQSLSREVTRSESPLWHKDALRKTVARHDAGMEQPIEWDAAKRELRKRAG